MLLIVTAAIAYRIQPFESWEKVKQGASEITIVRCLETPHRLNRDENGVFVEFTGLFDSKMEVVFFLKGDIKEKKLILRSEFWPRQGEDYLVFGHFARGILHAYDKYKIIPLGVDFQTNMISGKVMDEQIKTILDFRLANLNGQIGEMQEEKKLLEQETKK